MRVRERLKEAIILNSKNIPGWKTKRRVVVIECDDWGGIRMPSIKINDTLRAKGLKISQNRYNSYDTLETSEDLERLYDTLDIVKDRNNRPAVMTPVTNVANPDFVKISAAGFSKYYYEKFTDTLDRYYPDSDVFKLWQQGISSGIFVPELHGREHLTVQLWLQKLREGNKDLLTAFDNGVVSVNIPGTPEPAREFRPEFFFTSDDQKPFLVNSIKEGVKLFEQIFGYLPRVFVPSNNIFHPDFDNVVAGTGVKFLYVSHKMPYPANEGKLKYRRFVTGQKGPGGITYYTRNCAFEPTDSRYEGIDLTIRQIAAAFRWGKPANISTHRVNFAGGIDPANREIGLAELKKLLKAVVAKWPDVEFMSSRDALDYMRSTN